MVMGVRLRRFSLNMSVVGNTVCSKLGPGTTGCSGGGGVLFRSDVL